MQLLTNVQGIISKISELYNSLLWVLKCRQVLHKLEPVKADSREERLTDALDHTENDPEACVGVSLLNLLNDNVVVPHSRVCS